MFTISESDSQLRRQSFAKYQFFKAARKYRFSQPSRKSDKNVKYKPSQLISDKLNSMVSCKLGFKYIFEKNEHRIELLYIF